MSKKQEISGKILKNLAKKSPINLSDLKEGISDSYAFARAFKNLIESGFVETLKSEHASFARLTKKGRQKITSAKLDSKTALVSPVWDGKWRIIILDLPENRKNEREALRYLLKKAGFTCVKNTVWVTPYPFEHLFINIKKDLGFTTEIMIIVTSSVDEETEKVFQN